ncbi:MAG: hypothetical protein JXR70_14135 [Spirochaetales bacterium]|nr:hypothetical protein [Spirochaetales bacterium]
MKKLVIFLLLFMLVMSLSAQETKPLIVVMNFYYQDISGGDMSSFTSVVSEALSRTGLYNVMSIEDRDKILTDREYDVESCVQPSCQARAVKALNVDLYLTGDIGRLGNKYILHGAIINAKTGEVHQGLQYDEIYNDFIKMRDDMTAFTYKVCHLEDERITQLIDDYTRTKTVVVEGKASPGEIVGIAMTIAGLGGGIVGGLMYLDYDGFWNKDVQASHDLYMAAENSSEEYYSDLYNSYLDDVETSKSKFYSSLIVGGAGLVVAAIGGVVWGVSANMANNSATDGTAAKPSPLSFGAAYNGQFSLSMKLEY